MPTTLNSSPASSSTAILGKRRRFAKRTSLVLRLSGASCSSSSETEAQGTGSSSCSPSEVDDDIGSESTTGDSPNTPSRKRLHNAPILVNGKLFANAIGARAFACTYEGCTKSYRKPSRLEEHERSHTGERPFVCSHDGCKKTYLRESHLSAHARTHLSPSEKPFVCDLDGCGKRYWTVQHLRRHAEVHGGEKPFHCDFEGCASRFLKHKQLKGHIAAVHGAQGSKSFACEHEGCEKAFATSQKLRAHIKVHDERRYACSHPKCSQDTEAGRPYFKTWSELQAHNRSAHPATCPYPSCNGRIFNAQKNLKAHLKVHEQREADKELWGDSDADDEGEFAHSTKRRRGGEVGRDWKCEAEGCDKDFKSKKALKTHHNVTHLNQKNFACTHPGCNAIYGYKHLLQRHSAKAHGQGHHDQHTAQGHAFTETASQPAILAIDIITGKAYADRAKSRLASNVKILQCPYPRLPASLSPSVIPTSSKSTTSGSLSAHERLNINPCIYIFSRAYDLHRHLRTAHGLDICRNLVDEWVHDEKAAKSTSI